MPALPDSKGPGQTPLPQHPAPSPSSAVLGLWLRAPPGCLCVEALGPIQAVTLSKSSLSLRPRFPHLLNKREYVLLDAV